MPSRRRHFHSHEQPVHVSFSSDGLRIGLWRIGVHSAAAGSSGKVGSIWMACRIFLEARIPDKGHHGQLAGIHLGGEELPAPGSRFEIPGVFQDDLIQ